MNPKILFLKLYPFLFSLFLSFGLAHAQEFQTQKTIKELPNVQAETYIFNQEVDGSRLHVQYKHDKKRNLMMTTVYGERPDGTTVKFKKTDKVASQTDCPSGKAHQCWETRIEDWNGIDMICDCINNSEDDFSRRVVAALNKTAY